MLSCCFFSLVLFYLSVFCLVSAVYSHTWFIIQFLMLIFVQLCWFCCILLYFFYCIVLIYFQPVQVMFMDNMLLLLSTISPQPHLLFRHPFCMFLSYVILPDLITIWWTLFVLFQSLYVSWTALIIRESFSLSPVIYRFHILVSDLDAMYTLLLMYLY